MTDESSAWSDGECPTCGSRNEEVEDLYVRLSTYETHLAARDEEIARLKAEVAALRESVQRRTTRIK